jgi:F0F1-type ATP synthase membrane subunit c/vacuolar-type H+-ATPase subunit K
MSSLLRKQNDTFLKLRKTILLAFLLLLAIFYPQKVFAQTPSSKNFILGDSEASLGLARMIQIKDKDVKDGNVITSTQTGAVLSTIPYDGHVLGVVARDAAIVIDSSGVTEGLPVISTGQVYVLVSTKDGAIKNGDLLTTSTMPGIAVKAVKNGYVIGTALEDYNESDPQKIGKIAIDLDLHYFNSKPVFPGSLTDIFKIAILPTNEGPTAIFKYIIAALVVLGSFGFGFLTFGRTAAKGVEALGRNPSARGIIHLGIIFNVTIVITIILAGLTVAFLILRL